MKTTNVLIGVLMMTAIVMAALLLALPQREAEAAMVNSRGDYTMVTSGDLGNETITLVDNRAMKVIVYRIQNNKIELVAGGPIGHQFERKP